MAGDHPQVPPSWDPPSHLPRWYSQTQEWLASTPSHFQPKGRSPDYPADCTSLPSVGDTDNKPLSEGLASTSHPHRQVCLGGRPLYSDFGGWRCRVPFFREHPRPDFQYIKQCPDILSESMQVSNVWYGSQFPPPQHVGVPSCLTWYSNHVPRSLMEGLASGLLPSASESLFSGSWKLTLLVGGLPRDWDHTRWESVWGQLWLWALTWP